MVFFSIAGRTVKAMRTALAVLILGIGACSSIDDSGFYGYEDDFVIPEPDMVPVMPGDNPGRTVDEMLELKPAPVTVKKAAYSSNGKARQVYEQPGRFGSKEKISLRKGLNAPDNGIVYGPQKRRQAEEIRSLEVKKQEKDELQALSEEEMLAQIIAPKTSDVFMIEVVPAQSAANQNEPDRLLPLTGSRDKIDSNSAKGMDQKSFAPQMTAAQEKDADFIPFETVGRTGTKAIVLPLTESAAAPVVQTAEKEAAEDVGEKSLPDISEQKEFAAAETEKSGKEPLSAAPVKTENKFVLPIVPETAEVQAKEVNKEPLSIAPVKAENKFVLPIVPETAAAPSEEKMIVPLLTQAAEIKQEETISLIPPVALKAPEIKQDDAAPVLLKPPAARERLVLTPPRQEERIILKQPGQWEDAPSVEIFLDE